MVYRVILVSIAACIGISCSSPYGTSKSHKNSRVTGRTTQDVTEDPKDDQKQYIEKSESRDKRLESGKK